MSTNKPKYKAERTAPMRSKITEILRKGKLMTEMEENDDFQSDIIIDFDESPRDKGLDETKQPANTPLKQGKPQPKHPRGDEPKHPLQHKSDDESEDESESSDEWTDSTNLTTDMSDLTLDEQSDETADDRTPRKKPKKPKSLKPKVEKLQKETKKQKRTIKKLVKITKKARDEKAKGGNPQPRPPAPEVSHQLNKLSGILRL